MSVFELAKEITDRNRVWSFIDNSHMSTVDVDHGVILYIEDVSVSFDGFKALDNLNLYVNDGELRCIIGANGAGKTTLMDVVTGKIRPDSGSCYFGQRTDLTKLTESEIANAGIGRKFQKPSVFENLTVFHNLELSTAGNKSIINALFCSLNSEDLDRIDSILHSIGLFDKRNQIVGTLSHGQKQWLEIGMLLISQPRLLLIDEPVAGMTAQEMEDTAQLLTSLSGNHSVIVIEHDMAFVRSIAKTVTVLHQGAVLAEGNMRDVQNNSEVIRVYLGEAS